MRSVSGSAAANDVSKSGAIHLIAQLVPETFELGRHMPSIRGLPSVRVLRREAADRGPIEVVTALSEEPQKSVVQKTAERHGHA